MLETRFKKTIANSVWGLLPFVLFIVLHSLSIYVPLALGVSFLLCAICEAFVRQRTETRLFSVTFYISLLAIVFTLLFWILLRDRVEYQEAYVLVFEVSIVCLFIVFRLSKTYFQMRFFSNKTFAEKTLVREFYQSAALIQYLLTLHLFLVLFYKEIVAHTPQANLIGFVIVSVFPIILLVGIGIFQALRIKRTTKKLQQEEWLPIVSEKGEVTGKIAKSISLGMKNKFLHPVVRVALICNGKIYLQNRDRGDVLSPNKLDYPFEKYMLFNHDINFAARNSIMKMMDENNIDFSLQFVVKHVFDNEDTKRLLFLFAVKIEDENLVHKTERMTGKFWSIKQIEEAFADEILSECFELEFEYLKNMVLIPSQKFGQKKTVL